MADENYKYNPYEGMSSAQKMGLVLAQGAMAFGQGLTKTPYLSNFQEMQNEQSKQNFEIWKQKQQQALVQQQAQTLSAGINNQGNGNIGLTGYDLNPATGNITMKYGMTPQAKSKEEVSTQVSKDAMGRVQKLQELIPVLDQFNSYLSAVPVGTGLEGRAQGVGLAMSAPLQSNPYVTTAMTQLDALRPQIARGFGDVGNLSQSEQQTAKKFIPQIADNSETRVLKGLGGLTFIRRKVTNAIEKSGMKDDPSYVNVVSELDKRISNQFNKAIEYGVDAKQMSKFLGLADMGMDSIPVTKEIAVSLLKQAGGDKDKARALAKEMGLKL